MRSIWMTMHAIELLGCKAPRDRASRARPSILVHQVNRAVHSQDADCLPEQVIFAPYVTFAPESP